MRKFSFVARMIKCCTLAAFLANLFVPTVSADFWSALVKGRPETTKIMRTLPAVAERKGATVRFETEIAGSSIPVETATILREKIRTLLLHSKVGEIQLVDGKADTEIRCVVTSYEPKVVQTSKRTVGTTVQQVQTWIGNIGASVTVLDSRNHPIDAANVKNHLENDFVVGQTEQPAGQTSVLGANIKMPSWLSKNSKTNAASNTASTASTVSSSAGGSGARDKGGRPPTDTEWRDALIEGLASRVANRIVPIDEEFIVILPVEKEFDQARQMAKTGHWGSLQEQVEKLGSLSGGKEADRLYLLGLSHEASAYAAGAKPSEITRALNKATELYGSALAAKPNEHEFLLAQLRVQDATDHYLAIQSFLQSHPESRRESPITELRRTPGGAAPGEAEPGSADLSVPNNAAVIAMSSKGLSEPILLSFINDSQDPKFGVSAPGLIQLAQAKVSANVIGAIQKRMGGMKTVAHAPAARTRTAATHKVGGSTPVQ